MRVALTNDSQLTPQSPERVAKLLACEARYEETPLYALLVAGKAHAQFWQALLALKRQVLAG